MNNVPFATHSHKYIEKEWWQEWLRNLFPENYGVAQPSWGFLYGGYDELMNTHWYKNGDFIFGINYPEPNRAPVIVLNVLGHPEYAYAGTFNLKEADNEATFIEALVKTENLPLAVNVPWAKPFLEYFFSKK